MSSHAGLRADHGFEAGKLVVLDVDEEEAGGVGGKLLLDLVLHVALDQRDRGQRRQAQASRQQQQRRRRARPVQVADAQADRRPSRRRAPAGRAASPPTRRRGTAPGSAPAATQKYSAKRAVGGGGDGQRRPARAPSTAFTAISTADGRVRLRHQPIAEQRAARNARRSAQRPQREAQRDQQAVERGQQPADPDRGQGPAAPAGSASGSGRRPAAARRRRPAQGRSRQPPAPAPGSGRRRTPAAADAPRQRSVAIVRARASSQARTPLATPMPPTSSEVRPTSVRNSAVWSMNRLTPGAASPGSRMRQPWLGNRVRTSRRDAGRIGGGQADRVAHHRARARSGRSTAAHRPRSARAGRGSRRWRPGRARRQRAGDAERGGAEPGGVARMQLQPVEHDLFGQQAVVPVASAQGGGRRLGGIDVAPARPAASSHRRLSVRSVAARPTGATSIERICTTSDVAAPRLCSQSRKLVRQRLGAAVDLQVAAKQRAAVGGQAGIDRGSQGADSGDDADAKRQAQQDDPQAADAAAQFPAGERQGEDHAASGRGEWASWRCGPRR